MGVVCQVDPADVRFTQESVGLYFQSPYEKFSIREAVKRISRNEMRPDQFPLIRVISYDGCLWSVDNRRLWVFRFARCSSIKVLRVTKMHPRLEELMANSYRVQYCMMKEAFFFPRVRDRGVKDWGFDRQFPQPRTLFEGSKRDGFSKSRNEDVKPPVNGERDTQNPSVRRLLESPGISGSRSKPTMKDERKTECEEEPNVGKYIGDLILKSVGYLGRLFFGSG